MTATFSLDVADNAQPFPGGLPALVKAARQVYGAGCGPHQKFYDGGAGISAAWANCLSSGYGSGAGERAPYLCWRGNFVKEEFLTIMHEAAVKFPGHYIWVCNDQEFENKDLTPAEYQSKVTAMYNAIHEDELLETCVRIVPCMMGYQEFEAANKTLNAMTCIWPVKSYVYALAFDIYDMDWEHPTWDMRLDIAKAATLASNFGMPYWLGEWGVCLSTKGGDTQALRATRAQQIRDYMYADPSCLGGAYWENGKGIIGSTTACPTGNVVDALAGDVWPIVGVLSAALKAGQ